MKFSVLHYCRRVQADAQREQHAKDKQQQHAQELRRTVSTRELAWNESHCIKTPRYLMSGPCMQAQDEETQRERKAELAARTAAIQGLADMEGDPQDLWQAAVQLAATYTSASGEPRSRIISAHSP